MNKMSLSVREVLKGAGLAALVVLLTACASMDNANQPPPPDPEGAVDVGDVAIAGQTFAHAIIDLPEIASAANPPLVQFAGVTSIINGPVDPTPYTELLRDRLLLITREKLRFVERQLPQLGTKKSKKSAAHPFVDGDPDYEILAELRGNYDDDYYKIQIQFLNRHTGMTVYNALYRIRRENQPTPAGLPPATGIENGNPERPVGSAIIE